MGRVALGKCRCRALVSMFTVIFSDEVSLNDSDNDSLSFLAIVTSHPWSDAVPAYRYADGMGRVALGKCRCRMQGSAVHERE